MDKKERDIAYAKENLQQVRLNINKKKDADIKEWLDKKGNIQGYIKSLIRADIRKEQKKVKKTVFVVYDGACEIRTGHGEKLTDNEYAITYDPDPTVMGEFDNEEDALEYLHKNRPEMWVGNECGQGILKFIPIHGMWVAEEVRTYDEDGDLIDTEYAGTCEISKLPEEPEEEEQEETEE